MTVSMPLLRRLARLRVPLGFAFGIAALYLARPTWRSIAAGVTVGVVGQGIRIWAAGHLEKSREVTQTGPYRFTRHPLYVGSSVMAAGLALATRSWPVALLIAVYMTVTLTAAIRTEEAFLRERFGATYDAYASRRAAPGHRRFSAARAWRNREYRAVAGFALAIALLGAKAAFG
jgi:protein-S-isoprenylcysteine O-methyltransferase Ste14